MRGYCKQSNWYHHICNSRLNIFIYVEMRITSKKNSFFRNRVFLWYCWHCRLLWLRCRAHSQECKNEIKAYRSNVVFIVCIMVELFPFRGQFAQRSPQIEWGPLKFISNQNVCVFMLGSKVKKSICSVFLANTHPPQGRSSAKVGNWWDNSQNWRKQYSWSIVSCCFHSFLTSHNFLKASGLFFCPRLLFIPTLDWMDQ